MDKRRPACAMRCGEKPDISVFIHLYNWIIMRVDRCFVHHHYRSRHLTCFMIEIRYRMDKSLSALVNTAIAKKCFVCLWSINRKRIVIGRISAQTSAVFVFILISHLPCGTCSCNHIPNTIKAVCGLIKELRFAVNFMVFSIVLRNAGYRKKKKGYG